ncbi:MAG: asparagine synthase (glutamine-hydrolyzing) [Anaerolineae bacterium]|nr:asparagine synthase (glutamine-hydrolyzing) [Anaerolineae bacterium]
MCGIVGAYHLQGGTANPTRVMQAARVMRHRGPDGEGYLLLNTATGACTLRNGPDTPESINYPSLDEPADFAADLVLGHRRLAIIDLSPGGHEPMTIPGEQLWVTFNGEIYNYLEIRDELRSLGHTFHTESDVEVLLHAYEAWGTACLHRFIGMFVFALWDQPRRRLWCVRDRLGIKPFYYVVSGEVFAFASEIKALRVSVPEACTVDTAQLAWYLHYGLVFNAPNTFFTAVRELRPAHYLLIEAGTLEEPIRWWDVDSERARGSYNYDDPQSEFLRLMRDSVRMRLRSDVPVGTCLSGGLDSSTIVALATEQLNGGRMNSFSTLYPVKGMDETHYVDSVARHCNTIRHEITPTPENYLERLQKIIWHQDIPPATPTVYSQSFVMQLAHGNVTVLLDGQGADELFAGYLSHVVYHLSQLRKQAPGRWLREQVAFVAEAWPRFNAALNWREFSFRIYRYLRHGRKPLSFLVPEWEMAAEQRQKGVILPALAGADPLNQLLYRALVADSIPSLLHYEDRNSMAYSIEARVPFLDHRLVEFGLGLPAHFKVRGPETKVIMRQAMQGILPNEVVLRKDKLGYPTPFSQWLRGPLQAEIGEFLEDRVFHQEWIEPSKAKEIWQSHQNGTSDMGSMLHRMIATVLWLEVFPP